MRCGGRNTGRGGGKEGPSGSLQISKSAWAPPLNGGPQSETGKRRAGLLGKVAFEWSLEGQVGLDRGAGKAGVRQSRVI